MHSQLFFSIDPILLNTGIEISCSAWSENGSLLVIAGSHRGHVSTGLNKVTEREVNIVQFYSALGDVSWGYTIVINYCCYLKLHPVSC